MIDILVPVLARPWRARQLIESIRQTTIASWEVLFLCSSGDEEEISICDEIAADEHQVFSVTVDWAAGHGDWARKINWALKRTNGDFLLLAADDLSFHPNWDVEALRVAECGAGVIGTNDLGNATVMRGLHSTHPLVRRSYIEEYGTIDEPRKCLHEGYGHQWVDAELIETAQSRGQWIFAANSHVEHLHYMWHKSERDATYDKAQSTSAEDAALFIKRRSLWTKDLRARQRHGVAV